MKHPKDIVLLFLLIIAPWWLSACGGETRAPVVIYLDGAGYYSSSGSVKQGLRAAGYTGDFETYSWSAYLGPGTDHFITARSKAVADRLARRIEKIRKGDPKGPIHLMGLSAGTSVILSALEDLKPGVHVDNVVLFSSSVSSQHPLRGAMRHVRGRLYVTCSPHDGLLKALASNADGLTGPPAGRRGFVPERRMSLAVRLRAYERVVNIPWQPHYVAYGWDGGHTSATDSRFVEAVIGPRIVGEQPYPLDRSVAQAAPDSLGGQRP